MRYIIFSLIVLCVSFASAQGESTPHPTAVAMVDRAEGFVNQYLGGVEGFDATDYVNELKDLVYTIDSKTDLSHFKVDKYMDGVEDNVDAMLKNFGTYEKVGTYKEDYLKQAAEFFIKEYCKDMEGDITDIDTKTYIDDFERLNANFTNKLETLNAPESEGNVIGFDPENFLDAATGNNQRAAKIEFYWAGVGDHWLGINLVTLIETFQKNFFHDSVAQVDFAYLKDLWPQSAEVYAMNAAYDPSIYDYEYDYDYELYRAKQSGQFNNEYVIDEYGAAADAEDYEDQLDSKGNKENIVITDTTEYFSGGYSTYNNRRWGYNYNNNTTNTTIKLTTNGRTYSLQESIFTSPLIIDLDNDGAFEASKGMWLPHSYAGARLVEFDMDGDGFIDLTEWVGPNDGILMVRNAEVDANCFFGWAGGYAHGYEKLSLLDRNGDQQISGEELAGLCVWQDRNGNAQIDDGEVLTVQEMGITSFSLRHDNELVSSCEMNGARVTVVDWHPSVFVVRKTR